MEKAFKTQAEFRKWLSANHAKVDELWLRIYKKDSGKPTVTYAQALDEALCFGWIDGQSQSKDPISFLLRFTPRRPRSNWSKRNREHIERLEKLGKMRAAGKAQVEAAKADGRWEAAYDSPKTATIPKDFLDRLKKDKKAKAFFDTLNKTNLFAIAYRLQTAKKPETRERRILRILESLASGKKFHP